MPNFLVTFCLDCDVSNELEKDVYRNVYRMKLSRLTKFCRLFYEDKCYEHKYYFIKGHTACTVVKFHSNMPHWTTLNSFVNI